MSVKAFSPCSLRRCNGRLLFIEILTRHRPHGSVILCEVHASRMRKGQTQSKDPYKLELTFG